MELLTQIQPAVNVKCPMFTRTEILSKNSAVKFSQLNIRLDALQSGAFLADFVRLERNFFFLVSPYGH